MSTTIRRLSLPAFVLASSLALQGCAGGLGLTLLGVGAGTGASTGVNHTLGGITYKTFTAPPEEVHSATRSAMSAMGIAVESDRLGEGDDAKTRQISGKTNDRDIDVQIEEITPKTSRLRVVASQDMLFKDSATATEIIMQTAQALDDLQASKARAAAARSSVTKASVRTRSASK